MLEIAFRCMVCDFSLCPELHLVVYDSLFEILKDKFCVYILLPRGNDRKWFVILLYYEQLDQVLTEVNHCWMYRSRNPCLNKLIKYVLFVTRHSLIPN